MYINYTAKGVEILVNVIGKKSTPFHHTHTNVISNRIQDRPFITHLELCYINWCHYDVVTPLNGEYPEPPHNIYIPSIF